MPWRPMNLRGQRVLARCEPDGALRVEGGRVEIRYNPKAAKSYRAASRNLQDAEDAKILPDDHCAEAEPAPEKGATKKAKGGARAKKKAPVGPLPTEPEADEIIAYGDGACSGNPGPAGLGAVVVSKDGRRELSEYLGRGTNNIAELMAILRIAEAVEDPSRPVRIYTDSNYSIGVLVKGWKAKKNPELIAEVKRALARLEDVVLIHVPGHAGVELNERADELARAAVESRGSSGWIAA